MGYEQQDMQGDEKRGWVSNERRKVYLLKEGS